MENELHQLFLDELADVLDAERQLAKALPMLAQAAQGEELREAFEAHASETKLQASRLEKVFASVGARVRTTHCPAMDGLVKEAQETIEKHEDSPALDAAIIAAAQKAEHYEIASYGCLCNWAEMMGHDEALELLKISLEEEKATDERLTEIAISLANLKAEAAA